jgi:acetyl-CoA carboxylase carboxyl transferase subunit alpha
MARQLQRALADALRELSGMDVDELLRRRLERISAYGRFQEAR